MFRIVASSMPIAHRCFCNTDVLINMFQYTQNHIVATSNTHNIIILPTGQSPNTNAKSPLTKWKKKGEQNENNIFDRKTYIFHNNNWIPSARYHKMLSHNVITNIHKIKCEWYTPKNQNMQCIHRQSRRKSKWSNRKTQKPKDKMWTWKYINVWYDR